MSVAMTSPDLPSSELRGPLTNLPNRLAIKNTIDQCIAKMPGKFGLLEIDLDGLKKINDEKGHRAGDELIVKSA